MMPILEVHNLVKKYGDFPAVRGLRLGRHTHVGHRRKLNPAG